MAVCGTLTRTHGEADHEVNHVEFKASHSDFRCFNTFLDGFRSLSNLLCKCRPVLRSVERGNSQGTT
jgi:hypothetical protein